MSIESGLAAQIGAADEIYTNEVQTVTTTGTPTGGTFTLIFDGAATAAIAYNASAATIQAALEALPNIGVGGVACAGGPLPTGVTCTFSGPLVQKRNLSLMTFTNALTGGATPTPVVTETTPGAGYGDYVAPTIFNEFVDESFGLDLDHIESKSIRSNQRVLRSDRRVANRKGAAGDVDLEFASKAMGKWLKNMFGNSVITTPTNGVLARNHRYTLADLALKSLTFQKGVPDVNGTVRPFTYVGCKITGWELSCALEGILMLKLTLDAKDEDLSRSLAAASYAASFELLNYQGAQIQVAGANFDITNWTLRGEVPQKTDRRFLRSSTLKKEPIINDLVKISGTIDAEFTDLATYNKFVAGTIASIVFNCQGSLIETVAAPGPYYNKVVITMPACQIDGETPKVSSVDVIPISHPFVALDDGTALSPITFDWLTVDTTD